MAAEESFDLWNYLMDSLSLSATVTPPGRAMDPSSIKDHIMELFNQDPMDALGIGVTTPPSGSSPDVIGTPIQEFYRGLNIFITGGTGFIGKVLIQKLIRSIPNLGHIHVLIRPKRGKTTKERFERLFEDHVSRIRLYFQIMLPIYLRNLLQRTVYKIRNSLFYIQLAVHMLANILHNHVLTVLLQTITIDLSIVECSKCFFIVPRKVSQNIVERNFKQ